MSSWWNSCEVISALSLCARWLVAILGVAVLVLASRQSRLQKEQERIIREGLETQVRDAKRQAEVSLEKAKPRSVSTEQRKSFLSEAASIAKGVVTMIPPMGDSECSQYAQQLGQMLLDAGYEVRPGGMMTFGGIPVGLVLTVRNDETFPAYAKPLLESLKKAGIPIKVGNNWLQEKGVLGIVVGARE